MPFVFCMNLPLRALPWQELAVVVRLYRRLAAASIAGHLQAGARKVLFTPGGNDLDATIVLA